MTDGILYCFDSSALITAHHRYPIDMFPPLWDRLAETFRGGSVFLCGEAFDEIVEGDELFNWIKERENQNPLLVQQTLGEILPLAIEIALANPKMATSRSGEAAADPFVIAHAKIAEATVVTEENISSNPNAQKLPNACERMEVRCINFLQFMRDENYRF